MKKGITDQELQNVLDQTPKTVFKDCAVPPAEEVEWSVDFVLKTPRREGCFVRAKTWMAAREKAMRMLGCGPDDILVEML